MRTSLAYKPFVILFLLSFLQITAQHTTTFNSNGIQFIENKGQVIDMENHSRPDVKYVAEAGSSNMYLRNNGISYVLRKSIDESIEDHSLSGRSKWILNGLNPEGVKLHRVDMDFIGCNANPTILGKNQTQEYFNYYLAHCKNGINTSAYNKVVYQNIYNNIDIIFYGGKQDGIKYDIIIKPGGNPSDIKLQYTGADNVFLENNSLKVQSSLGDLNECMPKVYQKINGKIKDIKCDYELDENGIVKFKLENFNPKLETIIDPWITYYGSDAQSMALDADGLGNVVITGTAYLNAFPATPGAFQTANAGGTGRDVFVLKLDANGNPLWATYYGGSGDEYGYTIATDAANNIVIAGSTTSLGLPLTSAGFQTTYYGYSDAYIVKFNAAGTPQWATYFGGSGDADAAVGIATDAANNIVITGSTQSSDFPFTPGAFQTALGGGIVGHGSIASDAYLAKFDANGNRQWATYYGGYGSDSGADVAIDLNGDIAFTGSTACLNFPYTAGAFQTALNCSAPDSTDAFVVKFDANGNRQWATFLGGSLWDWSYAISADGGNNFVVSGNTASNNFPVSWGAAQGAYAGGTDDNFIIKFNTNGNRVWATYYGTPLSEMECYNSVDQNDNIYILSEWEEGGAAGTNPGLVFTCGYQKTFAGSEDQYITKFSPAGLHLCDTYLGGSGEDELDNAQGDIVCYGPYIYLTVGTTGNYPVTPGAFQTTYVSGAFAVSKLCGISCGDTLLLTNFSSSQNQVCSNATVNFNSIITKPSCDSLDINYTWTFPSGTPSTSTMKNPAGISFTTPGVYPVKLKITTPCETDSIVKTMTVVAAPTAAIFGNSIICPGSSVLLSASGGGTYSWSTGVTSPTINPTPASNTTYTVIVTQGTCTDTAMHSVNLSATSFAAITGNTVVCTGSAIVLTASGGSAYSWNTTGVTTGTLSVVPIGNTTYTLFATSGSCSDTVIHMVNTQAPPTAAISGNTVVCTGDIISLTAAGGGSYSWNTTATTTTINQASTGSGLISFSVIVTDAGGLCKDTSSINITVNPLPSITFSGNTSICIGDSAMITASGGNTYSWSTGANTANTTLLPSGTGNTIYSLTVTDVNGCIKDSSVTITTNQVPLANAGPDDTICAGEIATLNASGGNSYSWNNGASTAIQSVNPPITTSYTVIVSNGNCSDIDSARVIVNLPPAVSVGNSTTIFPGQSTTLTATGGGSYSWSPQSGLNCNTCAQPVATPTSTTKYYVTVTDANGCTSIDSVIVTVEILCKDIFIPNVFSPNDDGENDVFHIYGSCIKFAHLAIYDRWGEKVFETNNASAGWNGMYKGKLMDPAVFTYIFNAELDNGENFSKKGDISLVK